MSDLLGGGQKQPDPSAQLLQAVSGAMLPTGVHQPPALGGQRSAPPLSSAVMQQVVRQLLSQGTSSQGQPNPQMLGTLAAMLL